MIRKENLNMQNIFIELMPPWVETGLQPAFYDKESGTVLQQVARMYAKVNWLIKMFNKFSEDTTDFVNNFVDETNTEIAKFEHDTTETVNDYIARFVALKEFVDDYFDNLDVQEEINNKLDDMAAQGTLQEIIASYLQSNVSWTFDTVAEMKLATNLVDGAYAKTLGFHSLNDGGGALYYITDTGTANEENIIAIDSLYANLVVDPTELNVKQFGAYGDGDHDDITVIQDTINYGKTNGYYNIYLPTGNYKITEAIVLPNNICMYGENRRNVTITKSTNNTNNVRNIDAIILFEKDAGSDYNTSKTLAKMTILGNYNTAYGIYCYDSNARVTIEDCQISRVVNGVYWRTGGWLSTVRGLTINPSHNGFEIAGGTSTTLSFDNTYVNGGDGYGYYFRGVGYTSMNNVACDGNTGTAYFFNYSNLTINGFGCECPNGVCALQGGADSHIRLNSGTIIVNPTNASYICIQISGNAEMEINEVIVHDNGEADTTAGMFLKTGSGGNISFSNCRLDKKFAKPNSIADGASTQKIETRDGEYYYIGQADLTGFGNVSRDAIAQTFAERANFDTHMGGIFFNNRGGTRYSLNGTDRRYKNAHNLGDIFVNQAPALNGIAMFQQTSDSEPREMAGVITAVDINGTTGSITMDTLDLTNFSKNRGLVVEKNHDIEASSGGTATITGVDTSTNTLTLSNVSGSFDISDSVIYKGKTNIGTSTFSNIQSIGYGTTEQRPSTPVNGYMYWDTTLGKPIWRVGSAWKDATGTNV
jgi:hypothetical protein